MTLTASHSYSGDTNINNGALRINGTLTNSNVIVNTGATLGGNGNHLQHYHRQFRRASGPWQQRRYITAGSLNLTSGSILDYEFASTSSYDFTNVTASGGLTLNGGGFNIYQPGTTNAYTHGTYQLIGLTPSSTYSGDIANLSVLNEAGAIAAGKTFTFSLDARAISST